MEAFYDEHFPQEFTFVLNWDMDEEGQYLIGFARLAWAAWQTAQLRDFTYDYDETVQELLETQTDSWE